MFYDGCEPTKMMMMMMMMERCTVSTPRQPLTLTFDLDLTF